MDSVSTDSEAPPDSPQGSKLRAVGVAFGVALLGFLLAIPAGLLVATAYTTVTGDQIGAVASLGVSMVSLQGIAFPAAAWLYVKRRGLSWDYVPFSVPDLGDLKYVVGAYVAAFAALYAISALLAFTSTEAATNTGATTALEHPEIIPFLIPLQLLLIGPGEELLFRGVIQGRLRERFDAWPAILIASLAFAPAHILALSGGPTAVVVSISVLFVPSVLFGYTYEKTGNIAVPALTHGLYNATLFTLMYVVVTFAPGSASEAAALLAL
ncbi:CPBP family intramembrane glutamic endopeptidase [Halobacterium sp. CBA1126]|uniref:CPBP family intramembrane glutamic endopeptidase n=1 Tax=Halobacterium TaxID=2239 RepID=UPI0012FCEE41|nr:CPBP family intramembrane glutamic endopeptidase [Halobacterium sp. CBA1126]MUV60451.1 CPBP family intramembrane metalloprotease [Halobacterium sp. CBA1126]